MSNVKISLNLDAALDLFNDRTTGEKMTLGKLGREVFKEYSSESTICSYMSHMRTGNRDYLITPARILTICKALQVTPDLIVQNWPEYKSSIKGDYRNIEELIRMK